MQIVAIYSCAYAWCRGVAVSVSRIYVGARIRASLRISDFGFCMIFCRSASYYRRPSMSKPGPVEAKGVTMPMIDDQAEADEDLPKAIPPQARSKSCFLVLGAVSYGRTMFSEPPPKNVREAYIRVKTTRNAAELCAATTIFCGLICAGSESAVEFQTSISDQTVSFSVCMTIILAALSVVHLFLLIVGKSFITVQKIRS